MHDRAKFGPNRSNRGRDMAKMAAAAILNFKIFEILTIGTLKRVKLHHCVKFCRNRKCHSSS